MPPGGGRKEAPEWMEVSKVECDPRKVKCNHCGGQISAKIERVRAHLTKCTKKKLVPNISSSSFQIFDEVEDVIQAAHNSGDEPKFKQQRLMSEFVIKTTESQKSILDMKVAKFFYANNIAFNAANSKEYKEMLEALRPGYLGPNRSNLGGRLLDEASIEADELLKQKLSESGSVTLLVDGWTNIKNEPIMATCIHTGLKSFFLNAIDCTSNVKTAEYCANITSEEITYCTNLGINVFAVCTDNENKMLKTRELLEQKHEHLITYGCSAHYLNLLAEDISKKDILKHIAEVHKFFRNHHVPHGWLKEKNATMPQLSCETRWNSQANCVTTFIKNYHLYLEIQVDHADDFPANINRILGNAMIYREAVNMQKQLMAIQDVLVKMQSEATNLSDAVEYWIDLKENENLNPYENIIDKRLNQALTPFHFFANMLNPKYSGKRLTKEMVKAAEEWISVRNAEWLVPVLAFKIRDASIFPQSMFHESVINHFTFPKWWSVLEARSSGYVKEFSNFMVSLANCPASSAAIERMFSTCGLVWSKLRNSLGLEKAKKLVKVYRHLKNATDDEQELY